MDGKMITSISKRTFGTTKPNAQQLKYIATMIHPSSYILKHHSVQGNPITFNVASKDPKKSVQHRPFQIQILNDQHPNKAIIKSRQLGLTEIGVAEMLWWADVHSHYKPAALYSFPTLEQLKKFIQTRLNPTLQGSKYYSSIWDQRNDSLSRKQIRNSFLTFATSSSNKSMEGQALDYISLDELDRANPAAVDSAMQALKSSKFKMLRRWSTPTVAGMGIDKLYQQSDQYKYYHRCQSCNHAQVLDYEENIELVNPDGIDKLAKTVQEGTYRYVCSKCHRPLDRWSNGFWHSDLKSRTAGGAGIRGYQISQLDFVFINADSIKQSELNADTKASFMNYDLGKTYTDTRLAVSELDIENSMKERLPTSLDRRGKYKHIACGIDWGNFHWLVIYGFTVEGDIDIIKFKAIEQAKGVQNIEKDLREIIMTLTPFKPDIILCDSRGMGDYVWKLMNHFGKNIVYNCIINSNPRSNGMTEPKWNENDSEVKIDKLTENKKMISEIQKNSIGLYRQMDKYMKLFTEHWGNVVIRDEVDPNTKQHYQTISRKNEDHLAQAAVYGRIGLAHVLKRYLPDGEDNAFNYTNIGDNLQPTKPDIFTRGY